VPGIGLRPEHWTIGYRKIEGAGVATGRAWGSDRFIALPGDDSGFQADPMPFEWNGRTYLFFESFPYATRKGVIALCELDEEGVPLPPRTVLEQPFHLSYPVLIPHDGEIYMMPEMGASGRLQLFRADPFPDRWVPDRTLIEGCSLADATPVFHDGRWWLFAALYGDGGSTWDQLALFHAPDLLGPWVPHDSNPVLIDAGSARPAGAMWHEDGALMRVTQDCRSGYGKGLAICRVDRLDALGYAQSVVARLAAPQGSTADGTHTLNRSGGLEVIDLRFSYKRRWPTLRRSEALRAAERG
jgi:hypothetical protein